MLGVIAENPKFFVSRHFLFCLGENSQIAIWRSGRSGQSAGNIRKCTVNTTTTAGKSYRANYFVAERSIHILPRK